MTNDLMTVYFIIPDTHQFISGGNIYNQQLIAALRKQTDRAMEELTIEAIQDQFEQIEEGVFIVDTLYLAEIAAFLRDKKSKHQFILLVHHLQSLYPPAGYTSTDWYVEKEQEVIQQFDGFITTSSYTTNYLKSKDSNAKIATIPPALSYIPSNIPIRKKAPINGILAANLVPRKGILPFLKALEQTALHPKNISIEIAGDLTMDKGYADLCQELVYASNLKNYIRFVGSLSATEMHQKYRAANLFISTSFFETYGMALQEAGAWRLPILAVRGGHIASHLEEGYNGFLFDEMVDLVEQLKVLMKEEDRLARLLVNASQLNGEAVYTWESAAGDLLEYLVEEVGIN